MVVGFYGALGAAAVVFSAGRGDPDLFRLDDDVSVGALLAGPPVGIALGLLVVVVTGWLGRNTGWGRALEAAFRDLLGPLTTRDAFVLAAASSIGEELVFRGALLPWLGLWPQAILFALLHVGPGWKFLPWTLSALVLGVVLGGVSFQLGSIGAAIAAHFTINYLNLRRITGSGSPGGAGRLG